jgi:hypothetical protein
VIALHVTSLTIRMFAIAPAQIEGRNHGHVAKQLTRGWPRTGPPRRARRRRPSWAHFAEHPTGLFADRTRRKLSRNLFLEDEPQAMLRGPRITNQEVLSSRCYAYAAPTMIFLIRIHGEPCEMLLVCVG